MKSEIKKLAKLLRTSDEVVLELKKRMEEVSGQKEVIKKIIDENDEIIKDRLKQLKLKDDSSAELVFAGLINKVKEVDQALFDKFYKSESSTKAGCQSLIDMTKELTGNLSGLFLKEEKAKDLFRLNPPKKIMSSLGYDDLEEMLAKEDTFELFAALRFVEDSHWMNEVFFEPYKDLTKDDFEKRDIKVIVLPEKWLDIGQKFLGKKLHHMSHLKELGLVFIIPVIDQLPGEISYLFFMILHYIYEVNWHASLFEVYSQEENFTQKMIAALKVKASEMPLPDGGWRIIPSYLAKKNKQDPRLAERHINPEAWHYTRAAKAIWKFSDRFPEIGLDFWKGLEVAGQVFPSDGSETLISFDFFDNGISLLQQIGFESKYLYHQQEALWNKVFSEYMGEDVLDKVMMDNLDRGFVVL